MNSAGKLRLGDLASIHSGGSAPQDAAAFSDDGHPFIRAGSLSKLVSGGAEDDLEHIKPENAQSYGLKLFPEGTILFAKSGMSATKGHIYCTSKPSYVVNHLAAVRPYKSDSTRFLIHALNRSSPAKLIRDAAYPSIRLSDIAELEIEGPSSLDEQRRIAAILDKADALRRKRKRALDLLDGLTQSIFLEMFGDPIGGISNYEKINIGRALESKLIVEIQDGNHGEKHPKVSDFSEDGIPFITANCLRAGRLDTLNAYRLDPSWLKKLRVGFGRPGDVLLSHKGTVGEVAIVPDNNKQVILSPQVTYYRLGQQIDALYFMNMLRLKSYQMMLANAAEQSTRAYIGLQGQKRLPLIVPPLELQQIFASKITAIERNRACALAHMHDASALFVSLQHHVFSGAV